MTENILNEKLMNIFTCHQLINNGFYIYSRTDIVLKIRFTTFFAVTQNYDCFMNDSEIKSAFLSHNFNTVLGRIDH